MFRLMWPEESEHPQLDACPALGRSAGQQPSTQTPGGPGHAMPVLQRATICSCVYKFANPPSIAPVAHLA